MTPLRLTYYYSIVECVHEKIYIFRRTIAVREFQVNLANIEIKEISC
jgi:hypothetical protein